MQKRTHNPVSTVPQKMSENCLLHNNAQGKLCKKKTFHCGSVQTVMFHQQKGGKHTHLQNAPFSLFLLLILLPRVLQM
jgi:hypothetical protein